MHTRLVQHTIVNQYNVVNSHRIKIKKKTVISVNAEKIFTKSITLS